MCIFRCISKNVYFLEVFEIYYNKQIRSYSPRIYTNPLQIIHLICLTTASYFTSLRYYVYLQFKPHLHQSTSKYTLFLSDHCTIFYKYKIQCLSTIQAIFPKCHFKCTLYLLKLFCSNHCIHFTSTVYYVSIY